MNPQYSVSVNNALPVIGKVSSGSVLTNFIVDTGGGISISPVGSTSGQFIPYTSTRTSLVTVALTCSGNKCGNVSQTSVLTITGTTTHSGRFGQISGINILAPAGLISGGGTTASTTGSTLTVNIAPFTGTKNITVGMTVPVATSGTLGTASSTWTVDLSNATLATSHANGTVEGKLTIAKVSDLKFGTVILAGTNGTITWDAANQTLSTNPSSGVVVQKGTTSIGTFTVSGTPGQSLSFSLSGNAGLQSFIRLTNAQGFTLDITPATTSKSGQTIPGGGTFTFYVGGTISLSTTMHSGAYTGNVTVTANYE